MKIGILGGSFDPIHNGHINMAVKAYEEYNLDEVWLMPAGHSPNKDETNMTGAKARYEMCKLAAEDYSFIKVSDHEIKKTSTSFTYLTLQELCFLYPDNDFFFIMGADSLDYFEDWVHPEIIASLCTILVVVREHFDKLAMNNKILELQKLFPCNIKLVHCKRIDISSTLIRRNIYKDTNIYKYIPNSVVDYIFKHQLYNLE